MRLKQLWETLIQERRKENEDGDDYYDNWIHDFKKIKKRQGLFFWERGGIGFVQILFINNNEID